MASPMEEEEPLVPILTISVHDLRYFAGLLRGVNFANRATMNITKTGFTVTVEEARTLLATAYVFADTFDEYVYNPPPESRPNSPVPGTQSTDSDLAENTAVEIPLNRLIDCLNLFHTSGAGTSGPKQKSWRHAGDGDEDDDAPHAHALDHNGRIDQYFSHGTGDKGAGMRMSYVGPGHPLTFLIAGEAAGPTATFEIVTYEAEPHLELPFDADQTVLKIILKSSWLRDALFSLDPSCDKLTFVGNPPIQRDNARATTSRSAALKPMLRIQANGILGSTEMDYPNDREVLETFECAQTTSFSYRLAHIARTARALQSSTKTSLRIDAEGLLSLQFLMPSPKPRGGTSDAFIEFRCLPLDDDLV